MIAVQLHPHNGRVYLLYYTIGWFAYLRPTGTAEASSKRPLCAVHAQPHGLAGVPFFWNWLHQNNLLLVGIFIGVALIVPTQSSPSEYFRQQAGRLLVVGITAYYWIYRQLFELAHSGTERYRYIWARMQVYRVLLGTGTQDAQRRHSNRSGRRGRSQASPRSQVRSARTPSTLRTSTSP